MIVDTSALLAVLNREPDADLFLKALLSASSCRISVANALEASIVTESRGGAEAGRELDEFLKEAEIHPSPVTQEHLEVARQAWRTFGKGRHPAALDFGDCFAYALAKTTGAPLLYKGNDFTLTDIPSALFRSSEFREA